MATQPFTFPPPPPPPPPKRDVVEPNSNTYTTRNDSRNSGVSYSGHGSRAHRGSYPANRGGRPSGFPSRGQQQDYIPKQSSRDLNMHANPVSYSPRVGGHSMTQRPRSNSAMKRNHATAFDNRNHPQTRPQAAPSVPSFNAIVENLLTKHQATHGQTQNHTQTNDVQHKKKQNLLGLTPSRADSESEEDIDEEANHSKIANSNNLQFEYNGQQSTLSTSTDIAAWIAERRKKYPTQEKIAAAKKDAEEKRRQWEQQRKARFEDAGSKSKRPNRGHDQSGADFPGSAATSASVKAARERSRHQNKDDSVQGKEIADKLRRKAQRIEQKLAETRRAIKLAEVSPLGSITKLTGETSHSVVLDDAGTDREVTQSFFSDPGSSSPSILKDNQARLTADGEDDVLVKDQEENDEGLLSIGSLSDFTDESDSESTSSSGTSESDSKSAPEQSTTKQLSRENFDTSPARARVVNAPRVCKNLQQFGRCKFGARCRYSHDLPPQLAKANGKGDRLGKSVRRKGLWQTMVEKEKEERQKHILRAIIALGQSGMLDEPHNTTAL